MSELEKLRAEHAALGKRIAKLEGSKPASKPADELRGVTITTTPFGIPCVLPNHDELIGLMGIVANEFPGPATCVEYEPFKWAFASLGAMFRLPTPDREHTGQYFRQHSEAWVRSQGSAVDIGPAWFAAVLAWGEIPWVDFRIDGQVAEFGLSPYVGNQANEASWRRVLQTGRILPPTGPALRLPQRSPSRVYGGSNY